MRKTPKGKSKPVVKLPLPKIQNSFWGQLTTAVIFILFFISLYVVYFDSKPKTEITISDFASQVRNETIKEIVVKSDKIEGKVDDSHTVTSKKEAGTSLAEAL